jgi:protein ImuA
MQLVSCHNGVLRTLSVRSLRAGPLVPARADPLIPSPGTPGEGQGGGFGKRLQLSKPPPPPSPGVPGERVEALRREPSGADAHRWFRTGLPVLDVLPPGGAFARGAVHEVLSEPSQARPSYFALLLAKSAAQSSPGGAVVWSDPRGELYPPALAAAGLPLERLFLLRPKSADDEVWAITECLRSPGVAATVAALERLTDIQARRLQLAAERGGGVGLLLRTTGRRCAAHYAAATRWLVRPRPLPVEGKGDMRVQRWIVELIHGHGGQVAKAVVLEVSRGNGNGSANALDHVCAFEAVADRRDATPLDRPARVPA